MAGDSTVEVEEVELELVEEAAPAPSSAVLEEYLTPPRTLHNLLRTCICLPKHLFQGDLDSEQVIIYTNLVSTITSI